MLCRTLLICLRISGAQTQLLVLKTCKGLLKTFQNINLEIHGVDENFKFGLSGPYRCFKRLKFPISTSSKSIMAEVAIVKAKIPLLLRNNIFKPLEAVIKLFSSGNGVLRLEDADIFLKETSRCH